ncbi:UNVERIFIED_ORG: helix-turn-helix protein [Providencia alcalifaciens]
MVEIMNTDINVKVGKLIKRKRIERGLTGKELALMLNISQQQVSRYECGANRITIDNIVKISHLLNVDAIYLINEALGMTEDIRY